MRRSTTMALVTLATLAAGAVLASVASGALRVQSTASGGLFIEDVNRDANDFLELTLWRDNSSGKQHWVVFQQCRLDGVGGGRCLDLDVGPGCTDTNVAAAVALCERLRSGVTANLFGGDDRFVTRGFVQTGTGGATELRNSTEIEITDPITLSLGLGNDLGEGAAGPDLLRSGSGADEILADSGDDRLEGGTSNDRLHLGLGTDTAIAGDGDDLVFLSTQTKDGTDQVQGGLGVDRATYSTGLSPPSADDRLSPLRIIEGNLETLAGEKDASPPEDDLLTSIERYGGGASSDIITGVLSSNNSLYNGGLANDQLFGTSGASSLLGGAGTDQLFGRGGNDILNGKSGEAVAEADPVIDCGDGSGDRATIDLQDDATPTGCENIDRSAIGEQRHVKPRVRGRIVPVRRGSVRVRLHCPRRSSHGCAGTLELRLGAAATSQTEYAIEAGDSRRVRVRLGVLRARVGVRTVGQLVSLEPGRIRGIKTTLRRIVLSQLPAQGPCPSVPAGRARTTSC